MTYAAVVLFKVFLLVTSENHALALVLDQEQLHLPEYLDTLHIILANLSHNLSFHGANKFLDIILRLESSYKSRVFCLRPPHDHLPSNSAQQNEPMSRNVPVQMAGLANRDWGLRLSRTSVPTSIEATNDPMVPPLDSTLGGQYLDVGAAGEYLEGRSLALRLSRYSSFYVRPWGTGFKLESYHVCTK